jgi:hypothetical protein
VKEDSLAKKTCKDNPEVVVNIEVDGLCDDCRNEFADRLAFALDLAVELIADQMGLDVEEDAVELSVVSGEAPKVDQAFLDALRFDKGRAH